MSLSEFDLIKKYFSSSDINPELVSVGIGDDAAIINTKPDEQLVISVDTLNLGVHFPEQSTAYDIGYKALAVNLSDMAAMGAQPRWFTLAISLPSVDETWLKDFSAGMLFLAQQFQLSLIGGDTTRGSLSISIQIAGTVPTGKALRRSGAQEGDDVYVTGTLGDAAAGLAVCQGNLDVNDSMRDYFMQRLNRPMPRVEAGQLLCGLASACIDISDGFAADLGHILDSSGKGAEIETAQLPVSDALSSFEPATQLKYMLYGGDDYELCFTAPQANRKQLETLFNEQSCRISRIGTIIGESGLYQVDGDKHISIESLGFDHFKT